MTDDIDKLVTELRAARIVTLDFDPLATLPGRAADTLEAQAKELAAIRQDAAMGNAWMESLLAQSKANRQKERGVLVAAIKREQDRAEKAEQESREDRAAMLEASNDAEVWRKKWHEAEQERDAAHAVIAEALAYLSDYETRHGGWPQQLVNLHRILSAVDSSVLREHDERVKVESEASDALASMIGEGVHTGLRRIGDSHLSDVAWQAISKMGDEWDAIVEFATDAILSSKWLREHDERVKAVARADVVAELRAWSQPLGQSPSDDVMRLVIEHIEDWEELHDAHE